MKRDGRYLPLLVIAALTLLQILPVIWDLHFLPEGQTYTGLFTGGDDFYTYLAKMRLGFEGKWFYVNRYSAEGSPPALIFSFYLALGHLSRLLNIPLWLGFHLARWVLYPVVLVLLWQLLGRLVSPPARWLAFLLAVGASSFGHLFGNGQFMMAEQNLMIHLYQAALLPHYLVDAAAILAFWLLWLRWLNRPAWVLPVAGGLFVNLLVLVHPFMAAVALGVPFLYLLTGQHRDRWLHGTAYLAVTTLAVLPLMGYMAVTLLGNSPLAAWRSQAVTRVPPLWLQAIWLGFSQPLALVGLRRALVPDGAPGRFWLVWVALSYGFINWNPLGNAMEFGLLLSIPVGALAAEGAFWLRQVVRMPAVLSGFLLFLLVPGFILANLAYGLPVAAGREATARYSYLPDDYVDALTWLSRQADDQTVILGRYPTGNLLPAFAPVRVYIGHVSETYALKDKLAQAERFYTGQMEPYEAEAFVRSNAITLVAEDRYLVHDWNQERSAWESGLRRYPFLHQVYQSRSLTFYEVSTSP